METTSTEQARLMSLQPEIDAVTAAINEQQLHRDMMENAMRVIRQTLMADEAKQAYTVEKDVEEPTQSQKECLNDMLSNADVMLGGKQQPRNEEEREAMRKADEKAAMYKRFKELEPLWEKAVKEGKATCDECFEVYIHDPISHARWKLERDIAYINNLKLPVIPEFPPDLASEHLAIYKEMLRREKAALNRAFTNRCRLLTLMRVVHQQLDVDTSRSRGMAKLYDAGILTPAETKPTPGHPTELKFSEKLKRDFSDPNKDLTYTDVHRFGDRSDESKDH